MRTIYENRSVMLSIAFLCGSVTLAPESSAAEGEFKHQHIPPAPLINGWEAEGEVYVEPSLTRKLDPGQRVRVPDFGEPGRWYVQRLTDRTYWMICNAFASTAFVGDRGVLLDPDIGAMNHSPTKSLTTTQNRIPP